MDVSVPFAVCFPAAAPLGLNLIAFRLLLEAQVAEENLRMLQAKSPVSGGDFGFIDDFGEFDQEEERRNAKVYEKVLKADAKPVYDDPEDEMLGTEEYPYVFLCRGDSVTITKDFIKKWQKKAKARKMKHLYIALEVRDKGMNLLKSWISDVMLMNPRYSIDVDLTTGKTSYAAMNKPEEMAALLRKILKDVPEDERGQWLAVMLDKLMITTEKEEKRKERGELLASTINELSKEDQEELSAAAALLDEETLSILFRSLSQAMTLEKLEAVDEEAAAAFLTALLSNLSEQQVHALDAELIASLIGKLSEDQVREIGTDVIGEIILKLDQDQLRVFMQKILDERGEELTDILQEYLDTHPKQDPDEPGTGGQGQEAAETARTRIPVEMKARTAETGRTRMPEKTKVRTAEAVLTAAAITIRIRAAIQKAKTRKQERQILPQHRVRQATTNKARGLCFRMTWNIQAKNSKRQGEKQRKNCGISN